MSDFGPGTVASFSGSTLATHLAGLRLRRPDDLALLSMASATAGGGRHREIVAYGSACTHAPGRSRAAVCRAPRLHVAGRGDGPLLVYTAASAEAAAHALDDFERGPWYQKYATVTA
jgi:hypothetical protein